MPIWRVRVLVFFSSSLRRPCRVVQTLNAPKHLLNQASGPSDAVAAEEEDTPNMSKMPGHVYAVH